MRNKYICDLCANEIAELSWEDAPSRFRLESYCASQNPLGQNGMGYQRVVVDIAECCQSCQRALATAISTVLVKLTTPPASK